MAKTFKAPIALGYGRADGSGSSGRGNGPGGGAASNPRGVVDGRGYDADSTKMESYGDGMCIAYGGDDGKGTG